MGQQMKQPISRQQPNETRSAGAAFKAILPEDIDWKPFAAFPPWVAAEGRVRKY